MTHTYPAFEALGTAPDYLWIGAAAIRAIGGTQPQPSRVTRRPDTPEGELQAAQDYAAATGRTVEERETPRVTSQDGPGRAERAGSAG